MKILLDTHTLLWSLTKPEALGDAISLIEDPQNEIFFSSANIWEIAIKYAIGLVKPKKDSIKVPPDVAKDAAFAQGFRELPVTSNHAIAVNSLVHKGSHKDPFDRLLIAQAKVEGIFLLTADTELQGYNEPCVKIFINPLKR